MSLRYVEVNDMCHLNLLGAGGEIFSHKLWRESYYFNMTDPSSKINLITTIGILPNQKLVTGLFVLLKDNKILAIRPLIERTNPIFNDFLFSIKGLKYSVEGIDWRLKYNSSKIKFDIAFTPINKIYKYINQDTDTLFSRVGTQHYEQFGVFKGNLKIRNSEIKIGPCFGHRDHSWGIRDWSAVDFYRLFCCAFSNEFAFNLWEGSIGGSGFVKGYIFNGTENLSIEKCSIKTVFGKHKFEPRQVKIGFNDEENNSYRITSLVNHLIRLPPKQSVMYETASEMHMGDKTGYGLTEYLHHEPNIINRLWILLNLLVKV
jgi:hypothetical protein